MYWCGFQVMGGFKDFRSFFEIKFAIYISRIIIFALKLNDCQKHQSTLILTFTLQITNQFICSLAYLIVLLLKTGHTIFKAETKKFQERKVQFFSHEERCRRL